MTRGLLYDTPDWTAFDVEDMLALPDEFVRVKREPDKIALNRHFKETGELPAGCRLVEGVETITIRSK